MTTTLESFEVIKSKIALGTYSIISKRGRSAVWSIFGNVLNDDDVQIENVVACRECKDVLKLYKKSTTNLLSHLCVKKYTKPEISVSAEEKRKALIACAEWTVKDGISFSTVMGDGFKHFVTEITNIAINYDSSINVNEMLPDPTTVSRLIHEKYSAYFPFLKAKLENVKYACVTSDLWTDSHRMLAYLAVTVHYINDGKMIERLLAMCHFDYERQTAENIKLKIVSILNEFGMTDLNKITFVTDRGANFIAALREYNRLSCQDHLINNCLQSAFEETATINQSVKQCRQLVKYFKKSANLTANLKSTLKTDNVTRWNSKYEMLKSVLENWDDIYAILQNRSETHRISGMNQHQLTEVKDLLLKFKNTSIALQTSSTASLQEVLPHYYNLLDECQILIVDSTEIRELKTNLSRQLRDKWYPEIKIQHKAALFLFPPCKHLHNLTLDEIAAVHNFIKETFQQNRNSTINQIVSDAPVLAEPSTSTTFYARFLPSSISILSGGIENDISGYLSEPIIQTDYSNILEYWESKKKIYPHLYDCAQNILCICATSASSERAFSKAGFVYNERRTNLNPLKLNELLVLNSNLNVDNLNVCDI